MSEKIRVRGKWVNFTEDKLAEVELPTTWEELDNMLILHGIGTKQNRALAIVALHSILSPKAEKDHKCGGEDCIVCGYREKISKPLPPKEKIELLEHATRWDMENLIVAKINELIRKVNGE
jgi:hypothetical protein